MQGTSEVYLFIIVVYLFGRVLPQLVANGRCRDFSWTCLGRMALPLCVPQVARPCRSVLATMLTLVQGRAHIRGILCAMLIGARFDGFRAFLGQKATFASWECREFLR